MKATSHLQRDGGAGPLTMGPEETFMIAWSPKCRAPCSPGSQPMLRTKEPLSVLPFRFVFNQTLSHVLHHQGSQPPNGVRMPILPILQQEVGTKVKQPALGHRICK